MFHIKAWNNLLLHLSTLVEPGRRQHALIRTLGELQREPYNKKYVLGAPPVLPIGGEKTTFDFIDMIIEVTRPELRALDLTVDPEPVEEKEDTSKYYVLPEPMKEKE